MLIDTPSGPTRHSNLLVVSVPPQGNHLVTLYARFEGVHELLRAFLEKTDPQGPDTLGELFKAVWHKLRSTPAQQPTAPGQFVRTVGNTEIGARAAGKFAHALALTFWIGVCIVGHRIKQLAGSH